MRVLQWALAWVQRSAQLRAMAWPEHLEEMKDQQKALNWEWDWALP